MTYDAARGVVVMFGGNAGTGAMAYMNDTWTYNGTTWTELVTTDRPTGRIGAPMAYDRARSMVVQNPQVRLGGAILLHFALAGRVELEVPRVDDHVHPLQPPQLSDLRGGERCLHGAASSQHNDLADIAVAQLLQGAASS